MAKRLEVQACDWGTAGLNPRPNRDVLLCHH